MTIFDSSLSPEPIRGFSRHNRVQPPQQIQAWTAAAILAMKYEQGDRDSRHENSIPITATDPAKHLFEEEILSRLAAERY